MEFLQLTIKHKIIYRLKIWQLSITTKNLQENKVFHTGNKRVRCQRLSQRVIFICSLPLTTQYQLCVEIHLGGEGKRKFLPKRGFLQHVHVLILVYTVVSRKYAPPFAILALVQNVGGGGGGGVRVRVRVRVFSG